MNEWYDGNELDSNGNHSGNKQQWNVIEWDSGKAVKGETEREQKQEKDKKAEKTRKEKKKLKRAARSLQHNCYDEW